LNHKELETPKEIASKYRLFYTDFEEPNRDQQPITGAVPLVAFRPHLPSSDITTITEELSE